MQPAARALGLQVHVLNAITERDFDTVFATFVQLRAGALVIAPDAMFISRSEQLAALTRSRGSRGQNCHRDCADRVRDWE